MKIFILGTSLFLSMIMLSCSKPQTSASKEADGWWLTGGYQLFYSLEKDESVKRNGVPAVTVKSLKPYKIGFGGTVKSLLATDYLGKRIRLSGYLKTSNVKDWAGLWIRVDEKEQSDNGKERNDYCIKNLPERDPDTINEPLTPKRPGILAFDNMHDCNTDRSIHGTIDWKKYEIVVDVPDNSGEIVYGSLISGNGQLWQDDLKIEVVDISVPVTGCSEPSLATR